MSSPVVDSYLDELLADLPAAPAAEQAVVAAAADIPAPPVPLPPEAAPAAAPAPPADPSARAPAPATAPVPPAAHSPRVTDAAPPRATPVSAQHRWLRVGLGRDHYAFELLRVQEVVRMAPIVAMRGADRAVLGVMNLRGRIVPVFDLGRWLGGADVQVGERARIVVVERDDELIGVLVDDVEDVAGIAREQIEPPLAGSAAGAIVGIARVGRAPTVLLDANSLFE